MAMIGPDGAILGTYRKSHIPDGPGYEEKYYFRPGNDGFKVWDLFGARIGVGICWDQWYPECARVMALLEPYLESGELDPDLRDDLWAVFLGPLMQRALDAQLGIMRGEFDACRYVQRFLKGAGGPAYRRGSPSDGQKKAPEETDPA